MAPSIRVLLVDSLSTLTQYHPLLWWLLETGPLHVSQTPSEVPRDTESDTPGEVSGDQQEPRRAFSTMWCLPHWLLLH